MEVQPTLNPPSSHLPRNLVTLGVMLKSNGEVSPVIELSEGGWLCWTLFESTCLWRTRNLRIKRTRQLSVLQSSSQAANWFVTGINIVLAYSSEQFRDDCSSFY